MQFREFFLMGGRIACARSVDTKDLVPARLQAAVEALQKLRNVAEEVSDGLPCTVSLGKLWTDEEWEFMFSQHPQVTEAQARQFREHSEERSRRTTYVLASPGATQRYEILRGEEGDRAGLHGAINGMALNVLFQQGRQELSPEEKQELEATEETIWRACPAVITGDLDFTMDLMSEADLVAFSPYFAAAMLMNPV